MEFNARYILTAVFSLVVIFAGFMFVFWLNNAGGFSANNYYQVRFSIPVSGMAKGGNVLFNGVKVGEITKLSFSNERPSELIADISIAHNTPIREDTKAGIDYQGLTGAANILLSGGTSDAAALVPINGKPPLLIADPADTRSWTQNAGRVLQRIDNLFVDNKERFNTILAGLERLTGGGGSKSESQKFDLKVPEFEKASRNVTEWSLTISEPTILLALNTDKLQEKMENGSLSSFGELRWTDNLPNLFQTKIIQTFENAGFYNSVLRPEETLDSDYRLTLDIRSFHYRGYGSKAVVIDMVAKLLNADGVVFSSKHFKAEEKVVLVGEAAVIARFNSLYARMAKELVNWSIDSI